MTCGDSPLSRSRQSEHVVAASGGNPGLGVATAAKIMGLSATVYVPRTTPEAKARRIAAQGARVVPHGEVYADAEAAAKAWADESRGSYLHAYDDPAVIAGQGTIGLEIARHAP
jgi:threonine dehydratase